MLSHPFAFLCRLTICLCGIGVICGSKRNQLSRCIATLLFLEAFDKDTRTGRGKFLGVGAIDKFFQALAAGEDGPHRNLMYKQPPPKLCFPSLASKSAWLSS